MSPSIRCHQLTVSDMGAWDSKFLLDLIQERLELSIQGSSFFRVHAIPDTGLVAAYAAGFDPNVVVEVADATPGAAPHENLTIGRFIKTRAGWFSVARTVRFLQR